MKRLLQTSEAKTFLRLPRKKQLATFAVLLCLMAMMPLTARAQSNVINTISISEALAKTSTVYVGEVMVDGVSEIKTPMTLTPLTFEAVEDGTITITNPNERSFEYKLNDGEWTAANDEAIDIEVETNDIVQFRGDNATLADDLGYGIGTNFTATGNCYVYGNVMSLLSSTDFATMTEVTEPYCFWSLFQQPDFEPNTTILNHPTYNIALPATTVSDYGYGFMFSGCQGITRAPALPATTLGEYCYDDMFAGCTNLTEVPDLPTADLTDVWGSYTFMFAGCSSLVTAPALPAILLGPSCYDGIFMDCTSLVNAPELPATTMVEGCYTEMFMGCTSLETAPVLPAETLADFCYGLMFSDCTSLNSITCLATDITADNCTFNWVENVPESGTFYKAAGMEDWTIGISGIPEGWTVEDPYITPLTLEAVSYGEITFVYENTNLISLSDIEYQKNGGEWTTYTWNDAIEVVEGDKVAFRGNNETYSGSGTSVGRIVSTADVYVYGNVMSLIHADDFATNFTLTESSNFASLFRAGFDYTTFSTIPNTTIQNHPTKDLVLPATTLTNMCYMGMFAGCQGMTRAPELPATEMTVACYAEMFSTTGLTQAPVLPCTEMTPYSFDPETGEESGSIDCYMSMFQNCVNLTEAPELPATTLTHGVYQFMFNGCTSLTSAPELPATDLTGADQCYTEMFEGCTSLEECPELPATTLDAMCYMGMFSGCTSLTEAPALPATSLAEDCYHRMFEGCTSLTTAPELPAATLKGQCYGGMFDGCTSLQYVKCLATDLGEFDGVHFSIADWLNNVASTGTFIKALDMEDWPLDSPHGIPEGWTIYDQIFQTAGDWNVAANWNTNIVPAAGSNVVIEANATIPSGYIADAGSVFVAPSKTLTIADGGQLIHSNAVNATLQKSINAYSDQQGVNDGWYTIASPVIGEYSTEGLTVGTYDLYLYNEPTHYWWNAKGDSQNDQSFTTLGNGQGYLYANSANQTLVFSGETQATNTTVTLPLSYAAEGNLKGFNLVGNLFTRSLTSSDVIKIGTTDLTTYLYVAGGGDLVATTLSERAINPGEGFFVQATEIDQDLVINYATRGEQTTAQPAYLRIEVDNGIFTDCAYLQFGGGNTLRKMNLKDNTTKLSLQHNGQDWSVATIEIATDEMPVSFKAFENGTFTLSIRTDNVELRYLHLIDNLTGADIDLLQTPNYTFTAKTTDYESRFRLVFSANETDSSSTSSETFAFINNGDINILGDVEGTTLQIIDVMGHIVYCRDGVHTVSTTGMAPGVYVLNLIQGENIMTQKIVVR